MRKDKESFINKLKRDVEEGYSTVSEAVLSGINLTKSRLVLLTKYAVLTIILALLYSAVFQQSEYAAYTIFVPVGVLILYFYHEVLEVKVKNLKRFAINALFLGMLLLAIAVLFSATTYENNSSSPLSIIASSAAIFMFAVFMFAPIYIAKAGASPISSIKSAFKFITSNAMKTMFYIFMLVLTISIASSLPALAGMMILSPIVFFYMSYAAFIFIIVFWSACKKA